MWLNLQFPEDLVTFTEDILNGKLHFLCSDTETLTNFSPMLRLYPPWKWQKTEGFLRGPHKIVWSIVNLRKKHSIFKTENFFKETRVTKNYFNLWWVQRDTHPLGPNNRSKSTIKVADNRLCKLLLEYLYGWIRTDIFPSGSQMSLKWV